MVNIAAHLKHIDVLIADPDEKIRQLVRDVLANAGFQNIHQTDNGRQAIDFLESQNIDLLITDWRMTPVNGIQLIDYVRKDENSPNPYLPVIMLTGKAEAKDVVKARDSGVTEFLVKPFTAKSLFERLVLIVDNPRRFILADDYRGPDRRRRMDIPPNGKERRITSPINSEDL